MPLNPVPDHSVESSLPPLSSESIPVFRECISKIWDVVGEAATQLPPHEVIQLVLCTLNPVLIDMTDQASAKIFIEECIKDKEAIDNTWELFWGSGNYLARLQNNPPPADLKKVVIVMAKGLGCFEDDAIALSLASNIEKEEPVLKHYALKVPSLLDDKKFQRLIGDRAELELLRRVQARDAHSITMVKARLSRIALLEFQQLQPLQKCAKRLRALPKQTVQYRFPSNWADIPEDCLNTCIALNKAFDMRDKGYGEVAEQFVAQLVNDLKIQNKMHDTKTPFGRLLSYYSTIGYFTVIRQDNAFFYQGRVSSVILSREDEGYEVTFWLREKEEDEPNFTERISIRNENVSITIHGERTP